MGYYLDEKLLEKRKQEKKARYKTLETGVYINGEIIHFEEKELFGTVKVMLPDGWTQMPKEYARVKYPSEFRPGIIVTTSDLKINMGFTVFPEKIQSDDIAKMTENIRAAIHRSYPDYPMYQCMELEKIKGWYFDFRSHAMDSDLYNMILMAPVDKKLLQSSFNCPYKDYYEWKKTALMIWNTITKLEKEV